MITAHMHKTYILNGTTERSTLNHNYPVIVGSGHYPNELVGTALTIKDNDIIVRFTNSKHQIDEENILKIKK